MLYVKLRHTDLEVPDLKVKRSSVQIPNDTARVETEIAGGLAGIQPDDEFYTPTQKYKHFKLHTIR